MIEASPFLSCVPFIPHDYRDIAEGVLPQTVHEPIYQGWVKKYEKNTSTHCFKISYMSDEYRVTGLYLRPAELKHEGHPLIIFNRGGRGRYGMLNVLTLNNLIVPLVEKGYLVACSQYRGVDGGEGEDEFGGGEVRDITALLELAKQLPEWDGKNSYQFGWSRGGMMSLLALKHGAEVNATGLGAPLIDLTPSTDSEAASQKREAWLERVLPDYQQGGLAALEQRSAPYWLTKLRENPILLMHGDADTDVSVLHSRKLAARLADKQHPHRLIEYPGGNHYLNRERREVLQQLDEWFTQYRI